MLSERIRNIIVGLTTIVALAILLYGIVMISKPSFSGHHPYAVTLLTKNANGVGNGTKVDLNGVIVGQVDSISLGPDSAGILEAKITLQIDGQTEIPESATASLGKSNLGTPYISLTALDALGRKLPKDGSAKLEATTGDTGLIPKSIQDNLTSLSAQLSTVAKDLHTLLAYNTPEEVDAATRPGTETQPRPVENIATLVIRLNRTVKSLEGLLTDRDMQGQVRQIVQNLRDASVKINLTLASVDATLKNADRAFNSMGDISVSATKTLDTTQVQIIRVSERLVDMLGEIEKTTKQLAEGNGTTGKLINDPRLYEGLVDLTKTLRSTADDLDFLVKKWKDEGVNFKLK